uniref:Uncharacterized protein n=1 Tax=Romanomermis culicivorax TaxID=13658 RepID=A0A915HUW5_ROMCU
MVMVSESITAGWMGVDSSIGAGARIEISWSVSFKKSVICVALAVTSDGVASIGRADASVHGGSFAMLRSKIGVSKNSSSAVPNWVPRRAYIPAQSTAPSKETMMVCSPSTRENSAVQSFGVAVNISKTNIMPFGYAS